MHLVAFVYSPLQALNLFEYCRRFDRQVDVVVVGGVEALEPSSRTQLDEVLSLVRPRVILYREWGYWSHWPKGARRALADGLSALLAHLSDRPYEFVVGEYRSAYSWAVLHRLKGLARKVVVIDDGTAMLRIDRRRSPLRSRKALRQKAKSLLFLAYGIPGVVPRPGVTFFTTYAIDDRVAVGDMIVRNDYRTLSAELRALPPDDDFVYVIGTPHREVGVVDEGDVDLALELARFAAEVTGKKVVYVAHRREGARKLDVLRNEFTVVMPNVPFEIYPRVIGKRPRVVVGYYSSLFVTIADLLGDAVEVLALEIPRERINDSWLSFVDSVYRYYRAELGSAVRVVERSSPSRGVRS